MHIMKKSDYRPSDYYTKNPMIQKAVEFITGPQMMEIGKKENLERLSSELKKKDWFMTFLDLEDISEQKSGHWKIIQTAKHGQRKCW